MWPILQQQCAEYTTLPENTQVFLVQRSNGQVMVGSASVPGRHVASLRNTTLSDNDTDQMDNLMEAKPNQKHQETGTYMWSRSRQPQNTMGG